MQLNLYLKQLLSSYFQFKFIFDVLPSEFFLGASSRFLADKNYGITFAFYQVVKYLDVLQLFYQLIFY